MKKKSNEIQEPRLVFTINLLGAGLDVHNFVDFKKSDKSLHLKKDF